MINSLRRYIPIVLADFPEISLVYLFGSQVTGQTGPLSDIDLAILEIARENEYALQTHFQHAISRLLESKEVDIVLLDRAPIDLAYNIITGGILLYQKDTFTRVEFEAGILSRYGDYLPVLRSFNDQALQGGVYAKRVQRYREALRRTQRALSPPRTP